MKINPVKKEFYLNPIAQIYLKANQLIKVLIAGRGFGKSFINGISILMKVASLPRSKGIFLGATYTQILTNTLVPMKAAWNWFGYDEGIDYVVGKRPPKHFKKPYHQPDRYENVITFWNGTTVILGSMDRPQLLRGGSNDWVIVDEALLIKKEDYDQIIVPSIRGTHPVFKNKSGHLSEEFTSSMPYGSRGTWLLEKELESKDPKMDTFFIKGTSWHNRVVLSDKVIKKWKRTLTPIMYMIEVMSELVRQFGDVFYPSLRDHHWESNTYNYNYIDKLGLEAEKKEKDSRWDKDCDPHLPLIISHDWGAFNCITIDQEDEKNNKVRFINCMHVSHPEIIDDLAIKFVNYYEHHKKKIVHQFGDKSGNKKEANAKQTFFKQFASILRKHGWRVIQMKSGDVAHLSRHEFISKMHKGSDDRLPTVVHNDNNCKSLRVALEHARMKNDKKDKSSENNDAIAQNHATHYTDAYDYRLYHGFKARIKENTFKSEVSFSKD